MLLPDKASMLRKVRGSICPFAGCSRSGITRADPSGLGQADCSFLQPYPGCSRSPSARLIDSAVACLECTHALFGGATDVMTSTAHS
jgi:hypothetical protein